MNHDITSDCGMIRNYPSIEHAGDNVGLELTLPIDCSQMDVYEISSVPEYDTMMRKTVLHAFIINDIGEREELTITFELRSHRRPKFRELTIKT